MVLTSWPLGAGLVRPPRLSCGTGAGGAGARRESFGASLATAGAEEPGSVAGIWGFGPRPADAVQLLDARGGTGLRLGL